MADYTARPPITQAVRWTGDNLAEFQAWADTFTFFSWSFAQIGDALQITITPSGGGPVDIPLDQWAVAYVGTSGYSVSAMADADFQAQYQPLPEGTAAYTITGS